MREHECCNYCTLNNNECPCQPSEDIMQKFEEWLKNRHRYLELISTDELDMLKAFRSLQAWDEVLEELETEKNKSYENFGLNYMGLKRAIKIINQKLAEIEKVR